MLVASHNDNEDCAAGMRAGDLRAARVHNVSVSVNQVPAFRPLTGIYEPSAVQQLPDGRFLVVEDEKEHPLSLVTIDADGWTTLKA